MYKTARMRTSPMKRKLDLQYRDGKANKLKKISGEMLNLMDSTKILEYGLVRTDAIDISSICLRCESVLKEHKIFQHDVACKYLICGECATYSPKCGYHTHEIVRWGKSIMAHELVKAKKI